MGDAERGAPGSRLLDALAPPEREQVVARLRRRTYRRGQIVFHEGDVGDCLHLVVTGRLDVQVATEEGQTITLRVIHPGEYFGELALVQPDHRRTGRVSALEASETMTLHRQDFDELRARQPGLDRLLVVALAERVALTNQFALELLRPPDRRVWRRLLVLAAAYGDEPIRMSQDDLARAAGTVRQTVNRALRTAEAQGVVVLGRGVVRVVDRPGLERLARGAGPVPPLG